ncbi:DUF4405 domain-containing protein [Candidatus Bipolaricaulota bacterium]|nr:DUF4405 domain-containing protein [Candidatus Bipolaricaulota bacterium]
MSRKAVVCYAVDMFLLFAGIVCALSGFVLMAQGEGGYRGGRNPEFSSVLGLSRSTWETLHDGSGIAVTVGAIVHLWLHWRWILQMTKALAGRRAPKALICPPEERIKDGGGK